ncbi:hypothetical protein J2S74_003314 [Evansella vedderi]|uniref:Uncharacterized protein n=1 Tax=Evansella vedderi TaxID=38282 RepID=A0ABT9ZXG7_9BACI|nr:hypothetical protein [Evansella vedderi]
MPARSQDDDITPLPTGRGLPLGVIGVSEAKINIKV